MTDPLSRLGGSTARRLSRLGALARFAVEHRARIDETVINLNLLSRQMNHFAEEITQRPYRLVTGVKPYVSDSTRTSRP